MAFNYPTSLDDLERLLTENESIIVLHYDKLGDTRLPRIVRYAPGAVLKLGGFDLREEVLCAQYALDHLSIPIPRILHPYRELSYRNRSEFESSYLYPAYFAMEEVPGVSLDKIIDTLSMEDKRSIASQLRAILDQMRALKSTALGSVSGGPYVTLLCVPESEHPSHVFSSVGEFRDYFRNLLLKSNRVPLDMIEKTMSTLPTDSAIQFTHGNLLPKNIMVDGSNVTAIVDWANAGFYPAFWEYALMHDPNWMTQGWWDILGMIFPGERLLEQGCAISYLMFSIDHWL